MPRRGRSGLYCAEVATETPVESGPRHATWLELFFDLVAVAGIGQLTHLLHHGPGAADVALYLLLYLAFWMAWASICIYSNVAAGHTRTSVMLVAMLGLGVMAAAVPAMPQRHATGFAAMYVILRLILAHTSGHGRIMVDWPSAQMQWGVLPWVISLWVPEPWKYWLWAAGLAVDMFLMFAVTGARMMAGAQQQLDRMLRRSDRFDGTRLPTLQALHADPEHLGERLGLYVIIVLGEGVISVIEAVGGSDWNARVLITGFGAFVVLTELWALTLNYGFIPRMMSGGNPADVVPRQHVMAQHCWNTGAIATIVAGLGLVVEHHDDRVLPAGPGWVLCGGLAGYFLINGIGMIRSDAGARAILFWPVPCAVLAVPLAMISAHVGVIGLVVGAAVLLVWPLLWETLRRNGSGRAGDTAR